MANQSNNHLLTRAEAARHLGLKVGTLAAWAVRKYGPSYVKAGRAVRYRRTDLDAWLAANTVTPQ